MSIEINGIAGYVSMFMVSAILFTCFLYGALKFIHFLILLHIKVLDKIHNDKESIRKGKYLLDHFDEIEEWIKTKE